MYMFALPDGAVAAYCAGVVGGEVYDAVAVVAVGYYGLFAVAVVLVGFDEVAVLVGQAVDAVERVLMVVIAVGAGAIV